MDSTRSLMFPLLICILLVSIVGSDYSYSIDPSIKGIVYILPSKYCSSYWRDTYGDRIYFYVYANLTEYADGLDYDFSLISQGYNLVVVVIPADDTEQYYSNLELVDSIAGKYGLEITWALFPKSKYGSEDTYLDPGTPMHNLVVSVMEYLVGLDNTHHVAVWYGWSYRQDITSDLWIFYNSLPDSVKPYYAVWLDQPYLDLVYGINISVPVYTEIYNPDLIPAYTGVVEKQILVTGYQSHNITEWIERVHNYIESSNTEDIVIWIYYDLGDGHGEYYYAYKPGTGLGDPWSKTVIQEPQPVNEPQIPIIVITTFLTIIALTIYTKKKQEKQ